MGTLAKVKEIFMINSWTEITLFSCILYAVCLKVTLFPVKKII